jgi:RNA polymerase sigma-70 factor (ECF subfamily)
MSAPSDEDLMARYVGGDADAFRQLYERYAPRLTGLFRRGVRGSADVADLVQQTFFQLHRARLDFRLGSRVRPWLFSIALNLERRHFRDRSRRRTTSLEADPSVDATASGAARKLEAADLLRTALGKLGAGQREVIELHWFEGLAFAAVAERVGASLSAVKVRAHRGYKQLRAILEEK